MTANLLEASPTVEARASLALEYARRLESRRLNAASLARRQSWLANGRLLTFGTFVVVLMLAFIAGLVSIAWTVVPVVAFVALVGWDVRLTRRQKRAARGVAFYERGLARLEDRWSGIGETGERFLEPDHSYAADLDLFGIGSLFQRISTASTSAGEQTLAAWLLTPAEPEEVLARQRAVEELRPRLDLREDLARLGGDVHAAIDPEALSAWGEAPPIMLPRASRVVAMVLATLGVTTLLGWGVGWMPRTPFLAVVMVEVGFFLLLRRRLDQIMADVDRRAEDLSLLGELLARIEIEPIASPRLTRALEPLKTPGTAPSGRVSRLAKLVHLVDSARNPVFAPLAALMLWRTQLAIAIESWRRENGGRLGSWLAAVGEFEALAALAGYAEENPQDTFPEFVQAEDGARFEAHGLGHPLIPKARCVVNDVRLGNPDPRVLVVSGSNMSGKSTLLRSVGVAAVLAQTGAPVRARSLRLTPLAVGATLRIEDSIQEGRSRFYAEIVRVRQVVDLASGPIPLLFLFDEIFHGTNSEDRRQGAEGVVRALVARRVIGLLSTHDLALASIADRLAPAVANVHFEDQIEQDQLRFDYKMRPGVVRQSNALALMRAVGLDVNRMAPSEEKGAPTGERSLGN